MARAGPRMPAVCGHRRAPGDVRARQSARRRGCRGARNGVLRARRAPALQFHHRDRMKSVRYLIVGGGMTADAAAHAIREVDPNGSIGIISDDPHPPYNRPPLSKGLWKGDDPDKVVWRGTEKI